MKKTPKKPESGAKKSAARKKAAAPRRKRAEVVVETKPRRARPVAPVSEVAIVSAKLPVKVKKTRRLQGLRYLAIGAIGLVVGAIMVFTLDRRDNHDHSDAPPAVHARQAPGPTVSEESELPEFVATRTLSLEERLDHWSRYLEERGSPEEALAFVGASPEIEDSAPLIPKHFDCTTFVETVMALARSDRPSEFFRNLTAIRYRDSNHTFLARNHFPEADWIPNNERAGILKDVTATWSESQGVQAQVEHKSIKKAAWLARQAREGKVSRALASANVAWPDVVDAEVRYIPVAELDRVIDQLPSGTILNIVRRDSPRHPVLISHQGIVIRKNGATLLRHASPLGNVRTTPLRPYLAKEIESSMNGGWPVIGINLNRMSSDSGAPQSD